MTYTPSRPKAGNHARTRSPTGTCTGTTPQHHRGTAGTAKRNHALTIGNHGGRAQRSKKKKKTSKVDGDEAR